jgi:hypothetical protein
MKNQSSHCHKGYWKGGKCKVYASGSLTEWGEDIDCEKSTVLLGANRVVGAFSPVRLNSQGLSENCPEIKTCEEEGGEKGGWVEGEFQLEGQKEELNTV